MESGQFGLVKGSCPRNRSADLFSWRLVHERLDDWATRLAQPEPGGQETSDTTDGQEVAQAQWLAAVCQAMHGTVCSCCLWPPSRACAGVVVFCLRVWLTHLGYAP